MNQLVRMIEQLSQFSDELSGMQWGMPSFKYPFINLSKTDDGKYKFEFAVAGFDESELQVEAGPGYIQVTGVPAEDKNKNYVWKNISTKPFSVRIKVPSDDAVGVPQFQNGILSIELGEGAAVAPRKLTINKPKKA